MAYNNYYPQMTYQPNYYGNPYPPQYQPQQTQPAQRIAQPTIQQSGFVLVPSEQEARNYPVAPGNSITFKDENAPYCYVKTMGFNQLDRPTFEKYRLVKEDSPVTDDSAPNLKETQKPIEYTTKEEFEQIRADLNALKDKVAKIKEVHAKKRIEEVEEDDE